jgi:hypothetical protein
MIHVVVEGSAKKRTKYWIEYLKLQPLHLELLYSLTNSLAGLDDVAPILHLLSLLAEDCSTSDNKSPRSSILGVLMFSPDEHAGPAAPIM